MTGQVSTWQPLRLEAGVTFVVSWSMACIGAACFTSGPTWLNVFLGGVLVHTVPQRTVAASASVCSVAIENAAAPISLSCPSGSVVASVTFAWYGDGVAGSCASSAFSAEASGMRGGDVTGVVAAACAGRSNCTVQCNNQVFGDLVPGQPKSCYVRARCADSLSSWTTRNFTWTAPIEGSELADGLLVVPSNASALTFQSTQSDLTILLDAVSVAPADQAARVCERCGNGRALAGEECDDGNSAGGDGCDRNCNREPGYSCYVQNSSTPHVCIRDVCGDGLVTGNETCDDGNRVDGDGCSAACSAYEPRFGCIAGSWRSRTRCVSRARVGRVCCVCRCALRC
jgi:cysteine-rich repeat protein